MTKRSKYEATAPNGQVYSFNASTKPAAVRFLDTGAEGEVTERYIISTHKSVEAAGKSFQSPGWKKYLRPDSVVTEIREA